MNSMTWATPPKREIPAKMFDSLVPKTPYIIIRN